MVTDALQWGCDDRQGIFAWTFMKGLKGRVVCEQQFKKELEFSRQFNKNQ